MDIMVCKREVQSLLSQLEASTSYGIINNTKADSGLHNVHSLLGSYCLMVAMYVFRARYRIFFGATQFSTSRFPVDRSLYFGLQIDVPPLEVLSC